MQLFGFLQTNAEIIHLNGAVDEHIFIMWPAELC